MFLFIQFPESAPKDAMVAKRKEPLPFQTDETPSHVGGYLTDASANFFFFGLVIIVSSSPAFLVEEKKSPESGG